MTTPEKFNVYFAFFPYGGNGGMAAESPDIRDWYIKTYAALSQSGRVSSFKSANYSDTPITMTRNKSVVDARLANADVLVMVDSDMSPDMYLGKKPGAKPFISSSFDFFCQRKDSGLTTCIGAPYCGPPPDEDVYAFRWDDDRGADIATEHNQYTREEAFSISGITEVSALATGLVMFDMSLFELTDPKHEFDELVEKIGLEYALRCTRPWFYYEYKTIYQDEKVSTEDAVATRDIGLIAGLKLGYQPLFCNWDAWAGHWKPKRVGKPEMMTTARINSKYIDAVRREAA